MKKTNKYSTISGEDIKEVYSPEDLAENDYLKDIGDPGRYPYTRGIHEDMYCGKPWTIRQFAGFGDAFETNKRFKYLLKNGQTGLSVAFHLPTLMGYDSDHPLAIKEIGVCGVAVDSLEDMEIIFDGIRLDQISTSMTVNGPAIILLAMYLALAEKQKIEVKCLSGTLQNDILKEYIAQNTWLFPPKPSVRLIKDIVGYCTLYLPKWNTISISGYHIREAGATAIQELAFTLANGIEYVNACLDASLDIDKFAPRLSFFFNSHMDFFEEIAKFRAARRIWARLMKHRFKAKDSRSMKMRFHTQTAGCSLTAQSPENNIIRVALQALGAVVGGTNSLHTNSMDEALSLPSLNAVTVALRTQQVILHESGLADYADPLGGSYFIEALTNKVEKGVNKYLGEIEEMGGMVKAIERGFPQSEIMNASRSYQEAVEKKERSVVGVNLFNFEKQYDRIKKDKINKTTAKRQIERLSALRLKRDNSLVDYHLKALREKAYTDENLVIPIVDAVKVYATVGEIVIILKEVFGKYREPIVY